MCVIILRGRRVGGILTEEGLDAGGPLSNSQCFEGSCPEKAPRGKELLSRSPSRRRRVVTGGLSVIPTTWDAAEKDITTGPAQGVTRYGLVRDTRKDDTPVPQRSRV